MIYCDLRNSKFRGKTFLHLAVEPSSFPPATLGTTFATLEEAKDYLLNRGGYIIRLHRETIQRLKRIIPVRAGMFLHFLRYRHTVIEVPKREERENLPHALAQSPGRSFSPRPISKKPPIVGNNVGKHCSQEMTGANNSARNI